MVDFAVTIDVPSGGQASLRFIERDGARLTQEFQTACTRFNGVESRTQAVRTLVDREESTSVIHGVTCRFVCDPRDADLAFKKKLLKSALQTIEGQASLALPDNEMTVYCLSSKTIPLTASSNMSVGFVYKDPASQPNKLRVALILGDSIGTKTATRLLCDDVHDYYQPTFTVNARERRAVTAIFHEFGHIFHQIQNPSHYFGLADVVKLCNADAASLAAQSEAASFVMPTIPALTAFRAACSAWGRTVSQYASSHPNEFIAETFSGLMVGSPITDEAAAAYALLGGVVPPVAVRHVRSGQNAFKRNVLYPIATWIREIGEEA